MTDYAWVPCADGTIKKLGRTTIVTSVSTGCEEKWIAVANKLALVPGRRGEVVSMNGVGRIKDSRFLQHRIAIAYGVENDVYCFDGRGNGTIVTLDNNGLITVGEKFTCPGIVDPMNCIRDSTTLYIACRNEDVYSFDTTTLETSRINRYRDDVLTSVVDATTVTKLRNNDIYARLFGGATIDGVTYFVGNNSITTSTQRIDDSRISNDGIIVPVGADGTFGLITCPRKASVLWIENGVIANEMTGVEPLGMVAFSPSEGYSNEDDDIENDGDYDTGVYDPYFPLLPPRAYSTVTVSVQGSPNIPVGFGYANEGHGSELNGTFDLTVTFQDETQIAASLTQGSGGPGDTYLNWTLTIVKTSPYIDQSTNTSKFCGSVAPHQYSCRFDGSIAAYPWGVSSWSILSLPPFGVDDYPTGTIPASIVSNSTGGGWNPAGCPGSSGNVTIVSWNR